MYAVISGTDGNPDIKFTLSSPRAICDKMNKGKKANVKPFMVKNYLSVFINCMIENPAFDSQVNLT